MPELPEVESVRRSLLPHLVGARITAVRVLRPDVITAERLQRSGPARRARAEAAPFDSAALLQGATVTHLDRRGKQLLIAADSGRGLIIHLGMTGQVLIETDLNAAEAVKHTHLRWSIGTPAGPRVMLFRDARRFGGVIVVESLADIAAGPWRDLGPDALKIQGETLAHAARAGKRAIKAALLDQSVIAGVGNIYADEACHRSGIDPRTRCTTLSTARYDLLAAHLRAVLVEAINAGGSSLRDYTDAQGTRGTFTLQHAVYGRAGQPCLTCGSPLKSATVAGRTTVWCPTCQTRRAR